MNTGQKLIDWLRHQQLQVDAEWSIDIPSGFKWWVSRNAQSFEVIGKEPGPDGNDGYFIRISTEMWRDIKLSNESKQALNLLMATATMSGPVIDENGLISFSSTVRVHEGIWQWMAKLISISAMLQIQEAQFLSSQFAPALNAKPAESGHPSSGVRKKPDELASGFTPMLSDSGSRPSSWTPREFQDAVNLYMQTPPSLGASSGGNGLTVEFPFGDFSSLCEIRGDQAHPRIGNGLLILQKFPVQNITEAQRVDLAIQMNNEELGGRPFGYGFGSYCYQDECLCFSSFIPNLAYQAGLLPNLYFACAGRAKVISAKLTGNA
jgi:hypothetical protein